MAAQRLVRGGLGSLTSALASAARAAGADIRTDAEVRRIHVKDGRATGVTLTSGEELHAKAVVSNADPRRTLLGLIDPVELEPGFLARMRNYRAAGTVAKINLALSALPNFTSLEGEDGALRGLHPHRARARLSRARVRRVEIRNVVAAPVPGNHDSIVDRSDARAARRSRDVDYGAVRAVSSSRHELGRRASAPFADAVIATLAHYAPDLKSLILHRQVITPADLESKYGLTGGHIFHGELALDQLFTMRPLLGWARYRTPIRGLYHVRLRAHIPGTASPASRV